MWVATVVAISSLGVLQVAMSQPVTVEAAFPALQFDRPTDMQNAGDGTNRLFVLEQRTGLIRVFENDPSVSSTTVFLDIDHKIYDLRSETGLLGLAFHPEYEENGYFFVNYIAPDPVRTVVERYKVSESDPNVADPDSARVVLELEQPDSNHNGGQMAFGPDGYLYISFGDGGANRDEAQDLTNILGAIVRIDVNDLTDSSPAYVVPPDNPFVGNGSGYREEIWAYGLRNPWRFSFDDAGRLFVADVGHSDFEEINLVEPGLNYGWPVVEGAHCYVDDCDLTGLELPIIEYDRDAGRTVIGGVVYTGSSAPSLSGKYIYGDYITGNVWAAASPGGTWTSELLLDSEKSVSTFGVDESGEVYILGYDDGSILKFKSTSTNVEGPDAVLTSVGTPYPNPASQTVSLPVFLQGSARAEVAAFDLLGRRQAVVFDGTISSGENVITLDLSSLPSSGTYWLSVNVGGSRVWRQAAVVR